VKKKMAAAKTSETGLKKETAGALSYFLGPFSGLLFLVLERDPFVRFHAAQSIVVLGGLLVLALVLPFTVFLALLVPLVMLVYFVLWLVLIYKAWQGEEWEVPYLGKFARKLIAKA
jgi:uncharacterized membrane protein